MKYRLSFVFVLIWTLTILAQEKEFVKDSVAILFDFNKSNGNRPGQVTRLLKEKLSETRRIVLIAYTDSVGSVSYNERLASKRLSYAYQLLQDSKLATKIEIDTLNRNEISGTRLSDENLNRRVDILLITQEVPVIKEEEPMEVVLNTPVNLNVNFEGGKDVFLNTAYPNLDKLVYKLLEDTTLMVKLHGHVCCADDYPLSLKRAQAVQRYLIEYGVAPERISVKGFSNSMRLVRDDTEENRSLNRRVEAIFYRAE